MSDTTNTPADRLADLAARCATVHDRTDEGGRQCLRCDSCNEWVRPSQWAAHQATHGITTEAADA